MIKKPDLLILDYQLVNHDLFNAYRFMKENNCLVPLIFYNDPFPTEGKRTEHWETVLRIEYEDALDLNIYTPVLDIIANAVESKKLFPYIPLLQPPHPLPDLSTSGEKNNNIEPLSVDPDLFQFRKLNGMTNSLFLLLQILYNKRKTAVPVKDLQQSFSDNGYNVKEGTIYSLISHLRTLLRNIPESGTDIIKTKNGYRLFIYQN